LDDDKSGEKGVNMDNGLFTLISYTEFKVFISHLAYELCTNDEGNLDDSLGDPSVKLETII